MSDTERRLEELGARVARATDPLVEEALTEARQRFLARDVVAPDAGRPSSLWVALAVVAVVVVGLSWRPGPLTFSLGAEAGSADVWFEASTERPLTFSDGSTVAPAATTELRVEALSPRGATVRLRRGSVLAVVTHRDQRDWRFLVGPYEVVVTGTRFETGWDPEAARFTLSLLEGSVEVSGPGLERRRVVAGQSVVQGGGPGASAVEQQLPAASPSLSSRDDEAPPASRPAPPARRVRLPGEVAERPAPPDAEELLRQGDQARYQGRTAEAIAAYQALRTLHPESPRAPLAAFHLGVLSVDLQTAVGHLEQVRREAPSSPLARDALGRLVERLKAVDVARATAAAREYLDAYPEGPHAALARSLVGP